MSGSKVRQIAKGKLNPEGASRFCILHFKLCLENLGLPLVSLIYLQKWDAPNPEEVQHLRRCGLHIPVRSLCNCLSSFRDPQSRDFALDVVKTFISAFAVVAPVIAGVGLFLTFYIAEKDRRVAQERLITERFSKAGEQLGKHKDRQGQNPDLTVRIVGIYALERIAKDSPKYYWTIMEVLTSYVRENSPLPPELKQNPLDKQKWEQKEKELEKLTEVSIDVQAALRVIGRSEDPDSNREERIDLSFTNLFNAVLGKADLQKAKLYRANFQGAHLYDANLERADFWSANLQQANLSGANLQKTNLGAANLQGADLFQANLQGALIEKVRVENVEKPTAQDNEEIRQAMEDVKNLTPQEIKEIKEIKSACFWNEAIYIGRWDVDEGLAESAEPHNTNFIEELKKDKSSDPEDLPDCSRWQEE